MPSSESDSDEDCYGNVARKLQCLKNNYRADKLIAPVAPIEKTSSVDRWSPVEGVALQQIEVQLENSSNNDSIVNLLEEVPSVPDLPLIKLPNTASPSPKKRGRRRSARLSKVASEQPLPSRGKKNKKRAPVAASPLPPEVAPPEPQPAAAPPEPQPAAAAPPEPRPAAAVAPAPSTAITASPAAVSSARGRGGRRARGGQRGRGRSRSRRPDLDLLTAIMNSVVYSVGNTHEYPDTAENIPIFSQSAKNNDSAEVVVVDEASPNSSFTLDENEELSVKVYWQQTEYVKFNIRRFQKLAQIFEFFGKRESVAADKLLFTLRGHILRPDDTPDSVQYNVGLFIDGGIVNNSISNLAAGSCNKENKTSSTGIMLRFQCQNVKRPFETEIEPHQNLGIAMMKCAEHFELPYAKLRFTIDGEALSPTGTAAEQDLDHGDCIDVKTAA